MDIVIERIVVRVSYDIYWNIFIAMNFYIVNNFFKYYNVKITVMSGWLFVN